jgi:hypothetical protein
MIGFFKIEGLRNLPAVFRCLAHCATVSSVRLEASAPASCGNSASIVALSGLEGVNGSLAFISAP